MSNEQDKQHLQELAAYRFTVDNLRARVAELEAKFDAAPKAVQAAVPEAIEQMAVDRYKVVPSHESMFHRWAVVAGNGTQQLYIGREVECLNMARKFSGAFLDGAFVAMQNTAPAHPAESVPAQIETLRSELAEEKEAADNWRRLALQFDIHRLQALWHLKRILHADSSVDEYKAAEQFLAAPPLDGEAVLAQRIAALAATQPAAQGMDAGKLLAEKHTGMKVDYRGLLGQVQREIERSAPGHAEMLRQLQGHLQELGQRWYAGDTAVVDELLQLYCVERQARAALAAQAKQGEQAND